jgi:hypothetical protein
MQDEELEKPEIYGEDAAGQSEAKGSKKELWLFLIFLDIIALCILGFFVYTSFFEGINSAVNEEFAPQAFLEEIVVEDIKNDIKPQPAAVQSKPQEVKPAESAKPEVKQDVVHQNLQSQSQQPKEAAKPAEPQKQSVVITGAGKTRKATFKYFGDAKKVAVVAGFTMRKPVAMKKANGIWSVDLIIYPGEYRYLYIVDGKEMPDSYAKEDAGRSVLIVK